MRTISSGTALVTFVVLSLSLPPPKSTVRRLGKSSFSAYESRIVSLGSTTLRVPAFARSVKYFVSALLFAAAVASVAAASCLAPGTTLRKSRAR